MNLVIDVENTSTKLEVFENDCSVKKTLLSKLDLNNVKKFLSSNSLENSIDAVLMSSVSVVPENVTSYLKNNYYFILLDHNTPIPINNKYLTPESLGKDRLAAAVGANKLFPNENVLIIDCGTCVKYDFIDDENNYIGGAISPGLNVRFKALHNFTDRLPLLNYQNINYITGTSTEQSILSGVFNGVLFEIHGAIEQYQKMFNVKKIILSGGDMKYFEKKIKFSIFAVPNLVTIGLNEILNYSKSSS